MQAAKVLPNEKFKFEAQSRGEKKVVLLKGTIDEDTNFDGIRQLGGPLVFNFRDLVAINSCGIRSWVNFLKELGRMQIFYEECPPLVVRQLNMVPSFQGGAEVLSIYLPFVCDNCEAEKLVLLAGDKMNPNNIPSEVRCDACKKGTMEFDGHPQQYFSFLK